MTLNAMMSLSELADTTLRGDSMRGMTNSNDDGEVGSGAPQGPCPG